jgi:hypothetical protein
MLLIKITDGVPDKAPITLENFLLLFPATSFPGYLDASITEPLGYGIYSYSQIPDCDPAKEKPVEILPVRNDEQGVWYQAWELQPLTTEEKSKVEEEQRTHVLYYRNSLLRDSDWTQLPDVQMSEAKVIEWRVYRQELRDLLSQETFDIWHPIWPVRPS